MKFNPRYQFGFLLVMVSTLACAIAYWGSTLIRNYQQLSAINYPKDVNLGEVPEDATKAYSLVLHNSSNHSVVIKSIGTSCGCTTAFAKSDIVAANGNLIVNGMLHAEMAPGRYKRYVIISTAKPKSLIYISVEVSVYRSVLIDNEYVNFGDQLIGSRKQAKINIQGTEVSGLIAPQVVDCPPWLRVSWKQTASNSWTALLTSEPTSVSGAHDDDLVLRMSTREKIPFVIKTSVNVLGVFKCTPPILNFGFVFRESSMKVAISPKSHNTERFNIVSIPPGFQAHMYQDQSRSILNLTVLSDHSGHALSNEIVLKAVRPVATQKYIRIPVTAILQ